MINKTEAQVISSWKGDISKPLVSVRCLAYNHAGFITDALDGFLNQITSFPFEIVIHDDASTDGTPDIIKEYATRFPHIIVPILETENQYSKHDGSVHRIINPHLKGKYIALCEGDDYWTDIGKLEKQITYMEKTPHCSMTFHAADFLQGNVIIGNDRICDFECDMPAERIIEGGGFFCATASLCVRTSVFFDFPEFRKMANVGDYPLQILAAISGTVHYYPEIMSVYRYMAQGSWTEKQKSPQRKNEHLLNEIEWLTELDRYTGQRYHKSVMKRTGDIIRHLYKVGVLDAKTSFNCIFSMPHCREKYIYISSLVKNYFAKVIKRN